MSTLNFIFWDFGPDIFSIGPFTLRWYSVGCLLAFLIGQQLLFKIYKTEGKTAKEVDAATIYMIIGTIVGARLGHCLFYDPAFYLSNPIKILKVWEGGLASHGAAIGILISIYFLHKKYRTNYLWLFDRIVICVALAAMFIRLGNLMNSEIVGTVSNNPVSMVYIDNATSDLKNFIQYPEAVTYRYNDNDTTVNGYDYPKISLLIKMSDTTNTPVEANRAAEMAVYSINKGETKNYKNLTNFGSKPPFEIIEIDNRWHAKITTFGVPRHPAQTYEAFSSLILFLLLWSIYRHFGRDLPRGRIFGIFLIYIFGLRFFYEFLKENQSELIDTTKEASALNMGQLLSIPLVAVGVLILIYSYKRKKVGPEG